MLTDDERKKVADEAIRKAEIQRILETRTWLVEARVGSGNYRGESIRFLDGNSVNCDTETVIAELMFERDMWRRRAEKHGCNTTDGDPDCG